MKQNSETIQVYSLFIKSHAMILILRWNCVVCAVLYLAKGHVHLQEVQKLLFAAKIVVQSVPSSLSL